MNDQFENIPSDIKVRVVQPKQKDYSVVAISNPAYLNQKNDKKYDERIAAHIEMLNRQEAILNRDKSSLINEMQALFEKKQVVEYNGERTHRLFHSLNNRRNQETIGLFEEFNKGNGNYYAFDIETFGDSQERRKAFGISEIALNEYDKDGNLVNKVMNSVVKQDKDIVAQLQARLHELQQDKYIFNGLPGWEQRSLVDLMRYASHMDENDEHAFSNDKKKQAIQHHSIIKSVFNEKDQLDTHKVVRYMDEYLEYMQSGLHELSRNGVAGKTAISKVARIMAENPDKVFVSYNGLSFDMPVLQAFAGKKEVNMPAGVKHLDLLNVIKTTFMDSDDLKRMVDPDYKGSMFGKDKLAAFRQVLESSSQENAHNAQVDTDDTAKVAAVTREYIQEQIDNAKTPIREGFNFHPTSMTWNDAPMYEGQELFANGGVQAFKQGEESFKVAWDEESKQWKQVSSGFNKTVINSKSFYQFAGHEDMGDGKQAFKFFNPETKELSYIVRQGENAYAELQDFVQGRFYNWDNVDGDLKQEIRHVSETDKARRRYDRFFSMDGGGKGVSVDANGNIVERGTSGFSGLKRMLANAEVMQQHLESNGEAYRNRVQELVDQGMSRNQAKKQARQVRSHELLDKLDFNSMWDPEKKAYVFNQAEKDQFFKMYKRLFDEMPYLNQAINTIDAEYADEIKLASSKKDNSERTKALRMANQKRDQALMRYKQAVDNEVGVPEQVTKLNTLESHRLGYFDPEANDHRSINFESAETARNGIYGYAKRGIDDAPNKQRLMKERLFNLVDNLRSQGKIEADQHSRYIKSIHANDSAWNAAGEIAVDMRANNGGKYETIRKEDAMIHNQNIQTLDEVLANKNMTHENLIRNAIQDTQNATLLFDNNAVKGKKLVLGEEMRKTLNILDSKRFSGLQANNYQALETLVESIQKADPYKHISVVMDNADSANLKVYAYNGENSVAVQNQLQRGTLPTNALEINMPLIGESGTHKIGGQVINAHSIAVYNDGDIKMISSSEQIAEGYARRMKSIMKKFNDGDTEGANLSAKRALRNQVENMSGIQRNMVGENDSYSWANNQSDSLKQSHVKVANAMIDDLYNNGYQGIKLTEADFYDPDDAFTTKNGEKVLRRGLTFDDIKMDTSHKMLMKMPDWAQEKLGTDVFTSSLKAEHVAKGTVSLEDSRKLVPYGSFYNHGRDNTVQYMNAFQINEETNERIKGIKGISRSSLLMTPRQMEYEAGRPNNVGLNMKTAYMSQDELSERLKALMEDDAGRKMLDEIGLIKDGKLDPIKTPRLYEQQGILARDVADALEVDNEKRYAKGKQFRVNGELALSDEILPGTTLGTRIHDNGAEEVVRYEGTKPARVISGLQGDGDLILRWQSDPFKLMLDGEKMTDSPVDRRLINALTGRDDVVAIINPDVAKHKDLGMLMSGEARLMAEEINNLPHQKKKKAIDIVEKGGIGLTWNEKTGGFIDNSFDLEINKHQFQKVFDELNKNHINISPVTDTGVRVGILDAHMSKVSNYSKVIDGEGSGRRVLGFDDEGKKIYGAADGVQWGHREMGVLKSYGMEKTYNHVYDAMMEKTRRMEEVNGLAKSLQYMTNEHSYIEGLTTADFESLPENFRNANTYKGTIFDDKESIAKKFQFHAGVNEHGFWLNLPGVERSDGHLSQVKVNLGSGGEKTIDKIFIPFTATEGANGDVHLRELQKKISNIYKKADAVSKATSIEDARVAQQELQGSVNSYVKQSFKELTSSQGMLFNDVFKASMGGEQQGVKTSSASGLFKLMDYETSQRYQEMYGDGQHTVISEETAKKMGVYDKLKNGEKLFAANVRYPTFHDGAMQFTNLRMDAGVKEGEFHTTSFSSMLQNADSDGDYSHIVVMDDEGIQKEWKNAHDRTEQKFAARYNDHVRKETGSKNAAANMIDSNEGDNLFKQVGNSDEQMAAKVGKMTIGRASNLNLFIRQIADANYDMNSDMNYKMKEFGRGLEQKLIDAKHGAKPAGLEMINAIYEGKWDKAMEIDEQYFGNKFQDDFHMKAVAQEMPVLLQNTRDGLKSRGLKFGTSTGISYNMDSKHGIQDLLGLLHGNGDIQDFAGDNKALNMYHKYLREAGETLEIDNVERLSPIERLNSTPMMEAYENGKGMVSNMRNVSTESISKGLSNAGSKIGQAWESLKGMSGKNKMLLGGGLAMAGLSGYNILSTEKPEMHYMEKEQKDSSPKKPNPALQLTGGEDYSSQNADISIQASGQNIDRDQISHAVNEGMRSSGMNAGPTRMSINYQDNTSQLNRQWYRDTVRENI